MSAAAPASRVVEVTGGGRIVCPPGTTVLRAMVAAGRRDLSVGCRSGGCGVCRVRVEQGDYTVGPMSAAQVDSVAAAQGVALACRLFPRTDLRVRAIGRRPVDGGTDTAASTRSEPAESSTANPRRSVP